MADIQTILNFIDERFRKKHKPDSELGKSIMPISLTEIDKFMGRKAPQDRLAHRPDCL